MGFPSVILVYLNKLIQFILQINKALHGAPVHSCAGNMALLC